MIMKSKSKVEVFLNDDIAIIETEQDGGNANKIVLIDKKWKWGIKREK